MTDMPYDDFLDKASGFDAYEDQPSEQEVVPDKEQEATDWEMLARVAFEESETFIETSQRNRWMRNYSVSQSEHPQGSKYWKEEYKHKSKAFRGKTEASLRKNEAALGVALFTNKSAAYISPENASDDKAVLAAEGLNKLVNYRLGQKQLHWFPLVVGAYHDCMINGNVFSEQFWDYLKVDGEVITDKPAIKLYPLEAVHISPSADWLDPVNTSPYIIIDIPMYVRDIEERMEQDWKFYETSVIQTSIDNLNQKEIKRARTGEEQIIPEDQPSSISAFDIAPVRKVFIKVGDQDYFYFMLGVDKILSEPILVSEAYPHAKGLRPFAWGTVTIEPHKLYNRSSVDRTYQTQTQINEIANQRFDNVRQVLNKRKYALRNAGVDYSTLLKNISGSVIKMDDIDAVREEPVSDITGSSYNEQNLLNVDFDDLAGSFSSASVASNRSLNETVGGMQLLQGSSDSLTEYQMRVFVDSWVVAVVSQMTLMCQEHENDATVQMIANMTNEELQYPVDVQVDVGFGATDPKTRVTNLMYGIQTAQVVFPQLGVKFNEETIVTEIFGALGYGDGSKFIKEEEDANPEVQQLQELVQQLQSALESGQVEQQGKQQIEMIKQQGAVQKQESANAAAMNRLMIEIKSDRQIEFTKMAVEQNKTVAQIEAKTGVDNDKMTLDILKEANRRMDIDNKTNELNYKITTGNQGI